MGTFFQQLAERQLPGLVPGGFSWVDVRDVCSSILAAEERGRCGESYLLTGPWCSMTELAKLAENVSGAKAPAFTVPLWVAQLAAPLMTLWAKLWGSEPLYTKEALHAVVACRDISWRKAADELGHSPRPIEETVLDVYRWFAGAEKLQLPELAAGEVQL